WKNRGVHIVEGDLDDPTAYQHEMNGLDAIFFFQSLQSKNKEIQQGKKFIDTVISNDIKHFVYSSVVGADLNTGIPHFDSKYEIENHIRSSKINYSILRPASFYDNYLFPQVANGIKKGKFITPLNKTCKQQIISVDSIGKIAAQVISNPKKYSGKILSIATDEIQIGNLPELFSEAIDRPVKYQKLPGIIVRLAMGKDLHKMFKYMNKNDFCVIDNIQDIRDEFKINVDFKNWVDQHFKPDINKDS
ncbi:MAG: NmrA family NAD(P)-binding protein, partial [Bacteroidia bacterium]|nr:NmrA family NAD(P)-binding protein [Bacteroidia bacterium]